MKKLSVKKIIDFEVLSVRFQEYKKGVSKAGKDYEMKQSIIIETLSEDNFGKNEIVEIIIEDNTFTIEQSEQILKKIQDKGVFTNVESKGSKKLFTSLESLGI
ncbi:hypothetical protein HOK76_07545 [archaeon]|jgi:hypothetical protein|nr:hypothetical protein [archaeon]